ncbi:uncharacterized protein LOC141600673 [Silene latifolia]|uniref:uncharacterized protein LOC141600673 n=1 Tax=Silene latifolia TaxID=37657 RepID=UPI003D78B1FF
MAKKPILDNVRVFRCLNYAHNKDKPKDKFNEREKCYVLVGYPHSKKEWKLYGLKKRTIFESRDVIFYEHIFPFNTVNSDGQREENTSYKSIDENMDYTPPELQPIVTEVEPIVDKNVEERGSNEVADIENAEVENVEGTNTQKVDEEAVEEERPAGRGAREKFEPYFFFFGEGCFLATIDAIKEPRNYAEASKVPKWRITMGKEIEALESNGTSKFVELPEGK